MWRACLHPSLPRSPDLHAPARDFLPMSFLIVLIPMPSVAAAVNSAALRAQVYRLSPLNALLAEKRLPINRAKFASIVVDLVRHCDVRAQLPREKFGRRNARMWRYML